MLYRTKMSYYGGAQFISVADVQSAFWQIPVHPDHESRVNITNHDQPVGEGLYRDLARSDVTVVQNAACKSPSAKDCAEILRDLT